MPLTIMAKGYALTMRTDKIDAEVDVVTIEKTSRVSGKMGAAASGKTIFRVMLIFIFTIYIAFLMYQTFLSPIYGRTYSHRCVNIVPFKTIIQFLSARYNRSIKIVNLIGNIVAFIPLGVMLPLLSKRLSGFVRVSLISAGVSAAIEVMQYILAVGVTDIDDLLLNTLGGLLGSALIAFLLNSSKKSKLKN